MRDPKHPRHFTDEFKRQIVGLHDAGKPRREIMEEYDLGKSTLERWIKSINATGSPRAAGSRRAALLVKAAFAALEFPISDSAVFHTDRGSEFDNAEIDLMLEAFGVERSLSARGCPYDNAVDESTNKILKAGLVYRESFRDLRDLQAGLSDYVHWYNNLRIHSTLGYMSPVEFRKAGMPLSKPSK